MNYQLFRKLFFVVFMCLLLAGAVRVRADRGESRTNLSPQHREVLQKWLELRPWLRLANETDCTNKRGLQATRQEYGQGYQPYYAIGDFNTDGREDFAVVLVNKQRRSTRFAIAIFNGPFQEGRAKSSAFFTDGADLSDGGLIVLPGDRLIIGVFQTDNCVVLWPRGGTYVMEDCS